MILSPNNYRVKKNIRIGYKTERDTGDGSIIIHMEMPWRCGICRVENLVDMENLSVWPLDKLFSAEGFTCEFCGTREAVRYVTPSLREAEDKLTRYRPGQAQYKFLFAKLLRKAKGVNERGASLWRDRMYEPGSH